MTLNFLIAQIVAVLAWIFLIISYWKNKFISNIKLTKEVFSCSEKYCDRTYTDQAAPDRRMINDDLSGDGKEEYFKYGVRSMIIHHTDQFYTDDQVKTFL